MHSFVVSIKPKSYNSWGSASVTRKGNYKKKLEEAFKSVYPVHIPLEDDLYGLIYHFYRTDIGIDADNLSKPIWDCLRGIVFDDDKRVKMRIAGSFSLTDSYFSVFNSSGLAGKVIASLIDAIETEEHILYVECGIFTADMIRLNIEWNGN